MVLNTSDDKQIASHRVLEILIGAPPERLLIFTGIAIPEWGSNGDLDPMTVWVNLGKSATRIFQFTATAGLASIGADDDNGFSAATDTVRVERRDDTGELALVCDIAVSGTPAYVHRFAYQACVVVEVKDPLIAGTIRWPADLTAMRRTSDLFTVTGRTTEVTPSAGGGFGTTVVRDVARAGESDRPTRTGGFLSVPYVLAGEALVNLDVTVMPDAQSGAFDLPPASLAFAQVGGPRPTHLTPSNPQVFGVDFEMEFYSGVH
jgi:hypothetical protein